MSFNFDALLNQGNEAANLVTQNKKEIEEVLNALKTSLRDFLKLEVQFVEEVEYEDDYKYPKLSKSLLNFIEPRNKTTGFNNISIRDKKSNVKCHFIKLKHSNNGYPITVVQDKNHYVADNQSEFVDAVGLVVSNSQTHLMFRKFQRKIAETVNEVSANKPE